MVRRYFTRTRQNKSAQTLQNEMLSQLRRQSESLTNQLAREFANTLQQLQRQAAEDFGNAVSRRSGGSDGENGSDITASQARLFFNALGFLINRPRTKTRTQESSRSINANDAFRLSQSQMMIEAASALQNGDKNR